MKAIYGQLFTVHKRNTFFFISLHSLYVNMSTRIPLQFILLEYLFKYICLVYLSKNLSFSQRVIPVKDHYSSIIVVCSCLFSFLIFMQCNTMVSAHLTCRPMFLFQFISYSVLSEQQFLFLEFSYSYVSTLHQQ